MSDTSGLESIHDHLQSIVGAGAALAFGIALIASGFSSSTVGTYAGQVVMAGFVDLRISLWARRALTMAPSLFVLGIGLNPSKTLVMSQVVLSFGIPFALVPLVLISSDAVVMGEMVSRRITTVGLIALTAVIMALNAYLVVSLFSV